MLIKVENWGTYHLPHYTNSITDELGIREINGSTGHTFKIVDERLFLMNKLKYGIIVKTICRL